MLRDSSTDDEQVGPEQVLEPGVGLVSIAGGQRPAVRIQATEVIAAPRQAVWDLVADHRGWTSWFGPSLLRCEPTSEAETGVGSTRVVALRGGAEVHAREQVVATADGSGSVRHAGGAKDVEVHGSGSVAPL